ncbi:MAG: hypothetical protein PHG14_16260 [Desulfobacter postgatei]|uniref:hypothetical protein n=1 Tax=Desulfobacter postgatei TaxID=2293 RepID=UPI0023F29C21|nr:hypothetical protein [Desulfobacter postgatei]MDD4275265.1 hypothetical protein [Desulfobacter postgatei]
MLPFFLFYHCSFFYCLLQKKISLWKILTFEKEIGKVQNEVKDFKTETREFLNVYSNMITAISNTVNQTINVHLPGKAEAEEAKQDLNSTIPENNGTSPIEDEIESFLVQSGNDLNFALARLRMELERNLREILGKRTKTADPSSMKSKFLSARQLFKEFTIQYPDYEGMHSSFDYILKVCNAAIHGQQVYDGHGHEALYMGTKMLKEFEKLK